MLKTNPTPLNDTVKAFAAFLERCKGFTQDGYTLVFSYQNESLWYHRYRHPNGNVIELKLFPRDLRIVQLTNGKECFRDTMYQS